MVVMASVFGGGNKGSGGDILAGGEAFGVAGCNWSDP